MKKTNSNNNMGTDRLVDLLTEALGAKARKALLTLKNYRIETPDQFIGALMPVIPVNSEAEIKKRHLTCSLNDLQKIKSEQHSIRKISKTLQISFKDAENVFARLKKAKNSYQSYNFNFNFGFGAKPKQKLWGRASILKSVSIKGKGNELYVVPKYHHTGNVFDQGNRGTCVANAVVSLLDYKTNNRYSRQQVYHNAKCIDNSIEDEGTYIETPFQLLKRGQFKDFGFVREDICPYNPEKGNSTHQGPLPEKVYNTKRISSTEYIELPQENIVAEIIKHLRKLKNGKANLIVIGLPLFESFFSNETKRTGWVTMPLSGEQIIGYHAMLAVGDDQNRIVFLLRNSWGSQFASENDEGFVGHAWIPFEYIEKYCFSAVSVEEVFETHVYVSPEDRLSNIYMNSEVDLSKRAALKVSRNGKKQRTAKESKLYRSLRLLYQAAVLLLLFKLFGNQIFDLMGEFLVLIKEHLQFQEVYTKLNGFLLSL